MATRGNNSGNTTYLKINKDGVLYSSVTESEADSPYVKAVTTEDGRTFYHDLYAGGTSPGKITYMGIGTRKFSNGEVDFFSIAVEGKDGTDFISIPLTTQKGKLNGYVRNLARVLPNADYGQTVKLIPSTLKNDNGFVLQYIFIKLPDVKTRDQSYSELELFSRSSTISFIIVIYYSFLFLKIIF